MPNIILGQKPRSGTLFYQSGVTWVSVSEEKNYNPSKIFHKFKHEPRDRSRGFKPGEIKIYEGTYDFHNCLTLKNDNGYESATLQKVEVYFNQYDPFKTPLLFVLHFTNNGGPGSVQNRYYKRSDFDSAIRSNTTKNISDLTTYTDENSILCDLIKETDKLNEPITYNIGKQKGDSGRDVKYNGNKIQVKDDSSAPSIASSGFTRYKHTPSSSGRGRRACVIYKCNVLVKDKGGTEVTGIQGQTYDSVNVYFGDKAKRQSTGNTGTGSTSSSNGGVEGVPLLVELVKKDTSGRAGEPDYYVHKRNGSGQGDKYYWEKLTGETGSRGDSGNTLKDLLDDIGLSTSREGRGFEKLREMMQTSLLTTGGDMGDLSKQLQKAKGSKLHQLLQQPVNGSKTLLVLLLQRVQFNIVDSVVILVEKKDTHRTYGDSDIGTAIKGLEPSGRGNRINVLKVNDDVNGKITVKDATGGSGSCIQSYKYKVMEHDISSLVTQLKPPGQSVGIRFFIPSNQVSGSGASKDSGGGKYRELSLYGMGVSTGTGPEHLEYKYYTKTTQNGEGAGEGAGDSTQNGTESNKKVYVVFYNGQGDGKNGDPRPLLLCYQGTAYVPRTKSNYDKEWVKVNGVEKCVCNGDDTKLLDELTKVAGFLNEVRLDKGPGKCEASSAGPPGSTCGGENGQSCTYDVHTYNGQEVKVQVECCPVTLTAPPGNGCYRKLIHTPNGTEGGGTGFRLGNVTYNGTSGTFKGSIEYYSSSTNGDTVSESNKYLPLKQVTAYFYDQDAKYQDPLLVELEFKNGDSADNKEYYRLQPSTGGDTLTWEKDGGASVAVGGNNGKLVAHLDSIRYSLKKVLKVELHQRTPYKAMGRKASDGNGFTPVPNGPGTNGNQIQVQECTTQCTQLTSRQYKCFKHKITDALGDNYNDVGGIALTLPGTRDDTPIELKLNNGSQNGNQPIEQLTYNSCMGDVYVFFYDSGGAGVGSNTDTVPLMLFYDGKYYRPSSRDEYFDKWVCVKELVSIASQGPPCGSDKGSALAGQLDIVNRALNTIDLFDTQTKRGKDKNYGLPTTGAGREFSTDRVTVKTQTPKSPYTKDAYVKVVHRTKNGFTIGEIHYKGSEIVGNGITPNGGSKISVKGSGGGNGNHKTSVATYKWNTVVAYYSKTDSTKKLPQLIVILKTESEVDERTPVTGSAITKEYGYYILTNKERGNEYEYKWVKVTESTPVTLDDQTDFTLLNSIVILLEKQNKNGGPPPTTYGDSEISTAVKAAIAQGMPKSPGQPGQDVNRLTGKEIILKVESNGETSFLKGTGFKLITHDISSLVNLNGSLSTQLKGVTLIGGLRFLIPTTHKDEYKQLKLYDDHTKGLEVIKYHQSIGGNKINVFFYNEDPRPLLLCYNNEAYKPTSKGNYFSKWYKDEKISKCDCKESCEELLKQLVNVSDFLNPLDIKIVPKDSETCKTYFVHFFNGKGIKIKVEFKKPEGNFCYHKYTHTHCGTSKCEDGKGDCKNSGEGFRLGNIEYGCDCIKQTNGDSNGKCITSVLNGEQANKYKSADKVVVFYYKHDKDHENALMVVLCGSEENKCNLYYTLKEKGKKDYEKKTQLLDLSNKETLGDELDKVLFRNNKKLQVILDQRPLPQRYSPNGKQTKELSKCNLADNEVLKAMEERRKRDYDVLTYSKNVINCEKVDEQKKKLSDYFFYHVPLKTCYEAQLYTNDGNPVPNNGQGNTQTHYNIGVEEMKCTQLTSKGYRCYQHKLTEVVGIEEVGGLKLFLWANQGESTFKLHNGTEKNNGKSELKYNTCKGNLYVYFYGEDPRPLMLCYDGKGYKPKCKAEYEVKWVCVPDVSNCVCGEPEFDATNVLTQLYQLSMELNEVQLGETKSAFKGREQPGGHKYQVHKYNGKQVNVTVTGTDLSCYKQYVHRPEKGYRLGSICYNPKPSSEPESRSNGECKAQCTPATGINYSSYKQLISVSLYYYMYDSKHEYPLIVELGYKGELSDFFRLDDPGNTGGGTTKKWEKMTDKPDEVENGKHSCNNQQNGAKNGGSSSPGKNNVQKDEKCQLDAEFAKQAAELQLQIYESERGIPWDHNRYWYRVVDLEELIEARAYKIRKSLEKSNNLKYEPKDDNLILKTKDNCHEESVMGYVIGGGAVGVVY